MITAAAALKAAVFLLFGIFRHTAAYMSGQFMTYSADLLHYNNTTDSRSGGVPCRLYMSMC